MRVFGLCSRGLCSNVTPSIAARVGSRLHLQPLHPLNLLKRRIENHFEGFEVFDDLPPKVTTQQCFDDLLVPTDHVSRSKSDTYYIDNEHVLRTHTSAHQTEFLREGRDKFLVFGDCYRRDEIDAHHYPVFHQMEGVRVWDRSELGENAEEFVVNDLKNTLEGLTRTLLQEENLQTRWVDAYFPFTEPSFELEVFYQGDWMELLGCGTIRKEILNNCGMSHKIGWALGIGMERIAMKLFDIPDIRLFWSKDPRFLNQFNGKDIVQFVPFSKYPPCTKDISFWLGDAPFDPNDFCAVVRETCGDIVEDVELIDEFSNKEGRQSKCYRINYRSMERNLSNEEVDVLQEKLRSQCESILGVELR